MKKTVLVIAMTMTTLSAFGQSTKGTPVKTVTAVGQVERVDAAENQATVKIQGATKLYVIPQMTDFSADKLEKLSKGKNIKLKVDSTTNHILEIE